MLIRYFGYRDFNYQAAQVSYFFLNDEMEPSFDLIGNWYFKKIFRITNDAIH